MREESPIAVKNQYETPRLRCWDDIRSKSLGGYADQGIPAKEEITGIPFQNFQSEEL